MQSHVGHPGLVSDKVEARAYQLQAVDDAMAGSTLLILPTAAGKTAVAWMSIVERQEQSMGWALVIAPTVALSNQHLENALPVLSKTDEWNPIERSLEAIKKLTDNDFQIIIITNQSGIGREFLNWDDYKSCLLYTSPSPRDS